MKLILLSSIVFFATPVFSQNSPNNVEDHQFSLNVLLPGATYEMGISNNATLSAELAFGFALRDSDTFGNSFGIYPTGILQFRNYYNFKRRLERNKRISRNTGNYIAPTVLVQSGKPIIGNLEFASSVSGAGAVVYGLQRTGKKGFQFRFEVGPAYVVDEFDDGLGIYFDIKLGFVLGKGKKGQ